MGGLKKTKVATTQTGGEKGKEIRIVTKHVVTVSDVEKNPRLVKLLYVLSIPRDGISEKGLTYVLYYMSEKNKSIGYTFTTVGGTPVSRDLMNDLTLLKYTGLVEVDESKKLRVTGMGKELLDKVSQKMLSDFEELRKLFEENWPKVLPIDVEVSLKSRKR
ncbi:MAG: hypothetical protein QW159_03470 [Desulfurococcaceae archaeon]